MLEKKPGNDESLTLPLAPGSRVKITKPSQKHNQTPPAWAPGDVISDGYRIKSVLGRGGMGVVYLAERELRRKTLVFAIKTLSETALINDATRAMFLRELRTWIDLPVHPHIVRCSFFRTIQNKLTIFSEYVNGGSLQSRIVSRKSFTPPEMLDIAIQTASGLLAAHQNGVIHQDVKPANILMTLDGIAKITDFGLATVLHQPRHLKLSESAQESMTVSRGMTPLYCSYEQASGLRIDYRTDIWSWGLSILELWNGGATWRLGSMAPMVLEKIKCRKQAKSKPSLPNELFEILGKCFMADRSERWQSFTEIIDHLKSLYRKMTGTAYPRKLTSDRNVPVVSENELSNPSRIERGWRDPAYWMEKLRSFTSIGVADIMESSGETPLSLRAYALADLEKYETIQSVFNRLLQVETPALFELYIEFLLQRAKIHRALADYTGSVQFLDKAISVLEVVDGSARSIGLIKGEVEVLFLLSQCYKDLVQFDQAMQTIETLEQLLQELPFDFESLPEFLARAFRAKASLVYQIHGPENALTIFDQGQEMLETLVFRQSQDIHAPELAKLYATKATFLCNTGRPVDSLPFFDKASAIWEPLLESGRKEMTIDLANVYRNRAIALRNQSRFDEAVQLFSRFTQILETQVFCEGRYDLRHDLAISYMNLANGMTDIKKPDEAIRLFDKAIGITEVLFYEEGRLELAYPLALEYNNKAVLISDTGDPHDSLDLYIKSLDIYEDLVYERGLIEYRQNLAWAHNNLAVALTRCRRLDEVDEHFAQFESIFSRLIDETQRPDLELEFARGLTEKALFLHQAGRLAEASEIKKQVKFILETRIPENLKIQWLRNYQAVWDSIATIP